MWGGAHGAGRSQTARTRQTSRLALDWAAERKKRKARAEAAAQNPKPRRRTSGVLLGGVGGALVLTLSVWFGGLAGPAFTAAESRVRSYLAENGFTLDQDHLDVRGAAQTGADAVKAALAVADGSLIFDFDQQAARDRVRALPWVEDAVVMRLLPNRVIVVVSERQALAVWTPPEGAPQILDAAGVPVRGAAVSEAGSLPHLEGAAAPEAAAELVRALARHPALARRVDGFERIGGRRWDMKLRSGVVVRLPEAEAADALALFADLEARERLLELPLEVIDLRGEDLVLHPRALPSAAFERGA